MSSFLFVCLLLPSENNYYYYLFCCAYNGIDRLFPPLCLLRSVKLCVIWWAVTFSLSFERQRTAVDDCRTGCQSKLSNTQLCTTMCGWLKKKALSARKLLWNGNGIESNSHFALRSERAKFAIRLFPLPFQYTLSFADSTIDTILFFLFVYIGDGNWCANCLFGQL